MINIIIFLSGTGLLALWLILAGVPQRLSVSVALSLFILSLFGGLWVTYNPALSWPALLYLVSNIALCFIIAFAPISPRWIAKGIVILGGLLAFYFIAQYAHFEYQGEVVGSWARLGKLTGSWLPAFVPFKLHPNLMAGLLEGILLLSLGFLWTARGTRRWLLGAISLLLAYALLISGSRGAWLGLAAALSLGGILLLPRPARMPAGIGLGLTVGSLLGLAMTSQAMLPDRTATGSLSGVIPGRAVLYRNALHLLSDYPFTGVGLGDTFANVYSRYQILIEVLFVRQAHNLFLAIWLGQGLVGIVAAVWLLIEFYRFVIRVERRAAVHQSIFLFRGAWLGATAIFIHGVIDHAATLPTQFVMLGLTLALGRSLLARFEPERPRQRLQWRSTEKKAVAILLAIALIAAALFFRRALIGAWYANLGALQQTQADLSPTLDEPARQERLAQAIYYYEEALAAEPMQPTANRRLGMIALEAHAFETALAHLEQAYPYEPHNQATLKLLGYAYLWNGQLDLAEERFRQVERREEVIQELTHYWWWWGTQARADLSEYANQMRQRLLAGETYPVSERSQALD